MTIIERALASVLAPQSKALAAPFTTRQTADQIAGAAGAEDQTGAIYPLLEHLAANGRARSAGDGSPGRMTFYKT